jgi:hypothetical protein
MTTVQDYSFRKDLPILAGPVDGCAADATINDATAQLLFPNGISFTGFELNDQQRIPPDVLAAKITSLQSSNLMPTNKGDVDQQVDVDSQFYKSVKMEYCWYENRYNYLLRKYLKLLMSDNKNDVTLSMSLNNSTTEVNKRLQSLLEIMNTVANERAKRVDTFRQRHIDGNDSINKNILRLADIKKKLNSNNLRLSTQREMQVYTEEKNRALRVQVTVFAILNVVALGVVYTAYSQSV